MNCLKQIMLEITLNDFENCNKNVGPYVVQACCRKSRLLRPSDRYPLLTWLTYFFIYFTVRSTAPNLSVLNKKNLVNKTRIQLI